MQDLMEQQRNLAAEAEQKKLRMSRSGVQGNIWHYLKDYMYKRLPVKGEIRIIWAFDVVRVDGNRGGAEQVVKSFYGFYDDKGVLRKVKF